MKYQSMDDRLKAAVTRVPLSNLKPWLNQVHDGDCIELMGRMPVGSVDMIVTSPPYNLRNISGNNIKHERRGKLASAKWIKGYECYDDCMPHDQYVRWQRDCLSAMMRVLREDGAIFYNHKWRIKNGIMNDHHDIVANFPVRQIIIWKRAGGVNFNAGYFLPTCEVIYLICKPAFRLAPKANAMGDVWQITQENNNPHPAPYPVELARRCIQSTTGQVILDPFMGSGTTAIAAEACKRSWIGLELSKVYCETARKRIQSSRGVLRENEQLYCRKYRYDKKSNPKRISWL